MPDASSSKISSGPLERTSDYSPESAARHVRRIQEADRTRKPPGSRDIISEHDALVQWTDESGRVIPDSYIENRIYRGEIVYRDEGAEHEVYHDERGERAVKVTRPAMLVLEYLDSLALSNHIFGDDVFIVGVLGKGSSLRIVVSQRWVHEDEGDTIISLEDIDAYFSVLRFERRLGSSGRIEYYNPDVKMIASDAHAGNFIRSKGKLVPIDVIVERVS